MYSLNERQSFYRMGVALWIFLKTSKINISINTEWPLLIFTRNTHLLMVFRMKLVWGFFIITLPSSFLSYWKAVLSIASLDKDCRKVHHPAWKWCLQGILAIVVEGLLNSMYRCSEMELVWFPFVDISLKILSSDKDGEKNKLYCYFFLDVRVVLEYM